MEIDTMKLYEQYLISKEKEPVNEIIGISAIVVSSLLIAGAYAIYKKNFVKNAKACINVPQNWDSQEKNICILKHEIMYRKQQIMNLLSSKQKCSFQLKDEKKVKLCVQKIEREIYKVKIKLPELQKRLERVKLIGWD
jgi:hypothetical protein